MRNQLCWFTFIVNLTQFESSGKKEPQLGNGLIWLILAISVRAYLGLWLIVPATQFLHGFPHRWTVAWNKDEINISSLTWFDQSISHRNKKQIRQNVNMITSIDCCMWQKLSIILKTAGHMGPYCSEFDCLNSASWILWLHTLHFLLVNRYLLHLKNIGAKLFIVKSSRN